MVAEETVRELIEACQRGERDAFHALFEAYKDRVYSVALRFSGDPAMAMDIAQDTFVKLFDCIREFRGESSFDTWVYRMVANRCLDRRRSRTPASGRSPRACSPCCVPRTTAPARPAQT